MAVQINARIPAGVAGDAVQILVGAGDAVQILVSVAGSFPPSFPVTAVVH